MIAATRFASCSLWVVRQSAILRRSLSCNGRSARQSKTSGWIPISRSSFTECCVGLVFISPAAAIPAGQRTGKFRLGLDKFLEDKQGESRISREDFAIAIVDEIEKPKHVRKRFTVGY